MKLPASARVQPSFSVIAVFVIAAIVSSPIHCSETSSLPIPAGGDPRPEGLKPSLTYSPSDLEECVTSVVTLECSTRGRHTLEARVASSSDPQAAAAKTEDEGDDESERKIVAIRVEKKEIGENAEEEWAVFAELRIDYPDSPRGSGVGIPGVGISGSVGGPAKESYLRVTWDQARKETFGVYRCDVRALAERAEGGWGPMETFSTEPVRLSDRNQKVHGDSDGDAEDKEDAQARKAEREEDLKWRKSVDERLELVSKNLERLLKFAGGNAYKLNKIISQMAARPATKSPSTTRSTTSTTPGATRPTARRGPWVSSNTRKYVIAGESGIGTEPTPRRGRSYTTPTTRRGRSYTTPTTRRGDRSYTTPTTRRGDRSYTTPTTRRGDRSYTTPTTRRGDRSYTTPTTRRGDRSYTTPTTRRGDRSYTTPTTTRRYRRFTTPTTRPTRRRAGWGF